MRLSLILLCLFFVLSLYSCSPKGIRLSDYRKDMKNVQMGMSKQAYLDIFPKAVPKGAKQYKNGTVEVLELTVSEVNTSGFGWSNSKKWYYFYQDKLIQYGDPQDWPKESDLVIEVR